MKRALHDRLSSNLLSAFFLLLFCTPLFAQNQADDKLGSLEVSETRKVEKLAKEELQQSVSNYDNHRLEYDQAKSFIRLNSEITKVKTFIRQEYDYNDALQTINLLKNIKNLALEGVILNRDSLYSDRNLTTTAIILEELLQRTNKWLTKTLKYHKSLADMQFQLDSLGKDSVLYKLPKDSAQQVIYYNKLITVKKKLEPANIYLAGSLDSIQQIEIAGNQFKLMLESNLAEVNMLRDALQKSEKERELSYFSENTSKKDLSQIAQISAKKLAIILGFYWSNHASTFILMFFSIIILSIYFKLLIKRLKHTNKIERLKGKTFIQRHPIASSFLINVSVFHFFLPTPPLAISAILWIASAIAFSVTLWRSIGPKWYEVWITLFAVLIVTVILNLLLAQSGLESWLILLNSLVGIALCIFAFKKRKGNFTQNLRIYLPLIAMSLFQLSAIYLIINGHYNWAKSTMTNGYFLLVVFLINFWSVKLLRDSLIISQFFIKRTEESHYEFPLANIEKNLSVPQLIAVVLASIYLVGRKSYLFGLFFDPISEAFFLERHIGKFTYTIESIFVFILILVISWAISKIIAFVSIDEKKSSNNSGDEGPGSWLLLARIAIFTIGILLACMAAGIPIDRISVIIGALSVGIGFGLQTLINNLVSGLIIAFEKPINVGDIVEISGQVGKMKSIGIRSSVVTTWDGADVIIPNGDLMNQHLINWTLGNTKRRFNLTVGVAYGTNLEHTKKILLELLNNDPRILKNPEPFIQISEFNSSSIDFILKFWVAHFSIGADVKSELIVNIDKIFKENGIQIPFPQMDVHHIQPNDRGIGKKMSKRKKTEKKSEKEE